MRRLSAGALLLALAACGTGLPTPGGVHAVRPVSGNIPGPDDPDVRKIAAGPASGATALQVVSGWLEASSDPDTARRFLLPDTASSWNAGASTLVYADQPTIAVHQDAGGTTATADVEVTGVAQVVGDGVLRTADGVHPLQLGLRKADDQWRISSVPPGVVVPSRELRIGRCPVTVAWLSPDKLATVPQQLLLPGCDSGDLTSEAGATVRALLAGPLDLGGAVLPALTGTTTAVPVRTQQNSGGQSVVVDLAGVADPIALALLRQQLLRSLPGLDGVELLVDGQVPPTGGKGAPTAPVLGDPSDVVDDILTLPVAAAGYAVAPIATSVARLRAVDATTSVPELGSTQTGSLPRTWRSLGSAEPWEQVALTRDGTVWLVRAGKVWAVPPGQSEPISVTSPVGLTQLRPGRDGVHAVGVTTQGEVTALLLRGGTAPAVLRDPSATPRAQITLRHVTAVSAPEADGSVLAEGSVAGQVRLWRVETVLTADHLADITDDPVVQPLTDPCPSSVTVRLSTAPDRSDLAWCRDEGAASGTARSLVQGAWTAGSAGGPEIYPGS